MKVTIKIEDDPGRNSKLACELDVPDDWKPTFETFCKVRGQIRYLSEKLAQEFEPPPSAN